MSTKYVSREEKSHLEALGQIIKIYSQNMKSDDSDINEILMQLENIQKKIHHVLKK